MDYLLDTNTVTALIKQDERVTSKIRAIDDQGLAICVSVITDYEITRGLFASHAAKKLQAYKLLRAQFRIIWLDQLAISEKAANIYADLKERGLLIQDNDILIAATAFCAHLVLVTNDKHFSRISALAVENWLNEEILTTAITAEATKPTEKIL